jgi:hypothetical protein
MPAITLIYSLLLITLGVLTYGLAAAGQIPNTTASPTALIPAYVGALFLLLGLISLRGNPVRKHVMHAAAALSLLLTLAGLGMAFAAMAKAGFDTSKLARPLATLSQAIMGALSAVFLAACVNSFIQARKARKAA